jgi:opacity protein-like surface antigen
MNKMIILLGLLVAIMNVNAFGVGFIGTPTAELEQGQWNVGFNYMYSNMDLDKTKLTGSWQDFALNGTPTNNGTMSSEAEINDVKIQRYYGTIGYGITDSWEAYIQLGLADVKAEAELPSGDFDELDGGANFDNDFAYGWGTRYTFHEQRPLGRFSADELAGYKRGF